MTKAKHLLLVVMFLSICFTSNAQNVTINWSNVTLEKVLKEITRQTNYGFSLNHEMVDVDKNVSYNVNNLALSSALDRLFANSDIQFQITDKNIILTKKESVSKEQNTKKGTLSGIITDQNNEPIIGAAVTIDGSSGGDVTDIDGKFTIEGAKPSDRITISYIGYETQTIAIGNRNFISISLNESSIDIDDVVVVGYGIQKRSDITGSVVSVKASELTSAPASSAASALQGRVSGVMVQNSSGSPAGDITIRIRGANSLTYGNDPLVIVDGVQSGQLSSVNPNEIESIEVLKDAAALSVYGSRGANGVILVTTKSGGKEAVPAKISYNGYVSIDNVSKTLESLNASEYGNLYNDYYKLSNKGVSYFTDDQLAALGEGTDWQDEIFRTAISHNHNVSIGGNSNKISYFVSGSMLDKQGIIINSNYTQYSLRSNLKVQAYKNISFGLNSSLTSSLSQQGCSSDALNSALQWSPTKDVYEADGSYVQHGGGIGPTDKYNPVALANEYVNDYKKTSVNITPNVEIKFYDFLRFSSMFSYRYDGSSSGYFDNQVANNGPVDSTSGSLTTASYTSMQNTNILTFDNQWGDHSLTVVGVYEIFQDNYQSNSSSAQGIPVNLGYHGLQFGTTILAPWVSTSATALSSVMGRVNYSYKNKYMLSISDRYDGASQLAEGHKWDNFFAFSTGWNILEEPWMHSWKGVVDELKIRGSYGSVGNAAVPAYASQLKFSSSYDANGDSVITVDQIANENLKWERTTEFNVGVDAMFLQGRINISAEYYDKTTTDLLMWKAVPDVMGATSQLTNVGSVTNKGFDLSISGYPVNTSNFKWHTNFTFNNNNNKIIELDGLSDYIVADGDADYPGLTGSFVQMVGQPMGTFLGYIYDGVWKSDEATIAAIYGCSPGDAKYVDINNDKVIDSNDITIIGNSQAKYIFGWNNTFTYKNWELNMMWQGVAGNDIYNQNRMAMESYNSGGFPTSPAALNYWTTENENTDVPAMDGAEYVNSSRWVEDGSYLRLKNLSLAYIIPRDVLAKTNFFSSAKVYVSASNMLTITSYSGYDPEASLGQDSEAAGVDRGVYPSSKSFIVGLSLDF